MKTPPTRVRLADLDRPLPPVELPNGREVAVRHADGYTVQLLRQMQDDPQNLDLLWEVAERVLPDATHEEILSLTPNMVDGVVRIAMGRVEDVLAVLGNAGALPAEGAPEAAETAAPSNGSAPSTDSPPPTRSRGSRRASPAPTAAASATS